MVGLYKVYFSIPKRIYANDVLAEFRGYNR